jgi:hypothetical protein
LPQHLLGEGWRGESPGGETGAGLGAVGTEMPAGGGDNTTRDGGYDKSGSWRGRVSMGITGLDGQSPRSRHPGPECDREFSDPPAGAPQHLEVGEEKPETEVMRSDGCGTISRRRDVLEDRWGKGHGPLDQRPGEVTVSRPRVDEDILVLGSPAGAVSEERWAGETKGQ